MTSIKKKSFYPYIIASIAAVAYVSPVEAKGEFSISVLAIKIFPILYLILYMNSYLDSAFETNFNNKGGNGDKYWKERRHLATGVLCGLVCSSVADGFILVRVGNDFYLCLGTAIFALAQMCYINAMGFKHITKSVGYAFYGATFLLALFVFNDVSLPVRIFTTPYGALLITSLWRAIDRRQIEDGRDEIQKKQMIAGFAIFVASDFTIAISAFVLKLHSTCVMYLVLSTYYTAQGLIVLSVT